MAANPKSRRDGGRGSARRSGRGNGETAPGRGWLARSLLRLGLFGLGLAVGFVVLYGWYLDRQIAQRFAEFTASSQPSRVYARALILRANMAMT
ncbi:MAG: hypothetical protein WCZ02_11055, partial [Lysobacterales bacterium]